MLKIFDCADKLHQKYDKFDKENLMHIPQEFRLCIRGPPNSGKTSLIKNILLNANPFSKIYIYKTDPNSKEFDDIDHTILKKLVIIPECAYKEPHSDECMVEKIVGDDDEKIEPKKPIGLILEDFVESALSKEERVNLNRYMTTLSSHCNISIIISCQNVFGTSPSILRLSTHLILFRQHDVNSLKILANRVGLTSCIIEGVLKQLPNKHDFLMIDINAPEGYKYRINMVNPIQLD